MGCMFSQNHEQTIFQVINVDAEGNIRSPGKLEITDVALIFYQPEKPTIKWPLRSLRRYGFDAEHFSFECGRRCQTGPGVYAFRCRKAQKIFNLLQKRIQSWNSTENEGNGPTNFSISSSIDSVYLEPAPPQNVNPRTRFSTQNGGMIQLISVGNGIGGPTSPHINTNQPSPMDIVPLIPPLPINRPLSQSLYVNGEIINAAAQDIEETNNNKTSDEIIPPSEHSYLNSAVLELLQNDKQNSYVCGNVPEISKPNLSHLYMNLAPDSALANQAELSESVIPKSGKLEESMPNYINFEIDGNSVDKSQNTAESTKPLNYIVLDLEPNCDPPKSPTTPPPDLSKVGGYAAIDFQKTFALSHTVNPNFDIDSESSRKTRHSSNLHNVLPHERHSSTVSY